MATLLDTIASYVPTMFVRRWLETENAPETPVSETMPCGVLFADISGFTALAERLAQSGPAGAEELIRILNSFFGQLIELVYAHGGDIVSFAGDALLALWPATESQDDLETLTLRACQCGQAMRASLEKRSTREGTRLSLRVGIGVGDVKISRVGGEGRRWIPLVTGDTLNHIGAISHQAHPGEVLLTAKAYAAVRDLVAAEPLPQGGLRLSEVLSEIPLRPTPVLKPPPDAMLRAHLPASIMSRLMAGQTGWLAELRQVTVIFVNLPDLTYETPLDQAQAIVKTLQRVLKYYEGSINKLSVDEKGVSLVAAMGLPPLAHEDDPLRGVQAALSIHKALSALGVRSATGVTTGRVFCGEVGNGRRREYTMIGDTVNLAARLMQVARDGILCDLTTFQATNGRMVYDTLPTITAKGKTGPVGIFRPRGEATKIQPVATAMIGREKERKTLARLLDGLVDRAEGGVVFIEGEAGMGKTRLIADLLERADERNVDVLSGWGDPIEKTAPYRAWRPVFHQLLKLDATGENLASKQTQVLRYLERDPELLSLAPLLNTLLPLELPDTESTGRLIGKVRFDNLNGLLVALLQGVASARPLLLVLEDVHWLDSASWALALLVNQLVSPILFVIATRPLNDPLPLEYLHILANPETEEIRLEALSPEETLELVKQRLGVRDLPPAVADLIREKAEGHPFFSEELVHSLRDSGLIAIEAEACRLTPGAGDLRSLNLPNTVEGVITSRIDRLTPAQQLTLKVASVIGRAFSLRTLHEVYPIEIDETELAAHMRTLERLDLTPPVRSGPEKAYNFKHVITQEVVYNLMLFSQRQQLHRSVAQWFERTYHEDLSGYFELLAHHWSKAEVRPKAGIYLEKAAEHAIQAGSYREAIRYFTELFALDEEAGARHHRVKQAMRYRQLGRAYLGIGQLGKSREALEAALELLGSPIPKERPRALRSLIEHMARHAIQSLESRRPTLDETRRERRLEMARCLEALVQIHWYSNEPMEGIIGTVAACNAVGNLGPSPELARACSNLAVVAGVTRMHGLARRYADRAHAIATDAGDAATFVYVSLRRSLYGLGVGAWDAARENLAQTLTICERLGDQRQWAECLAQGQSLAAFEGEFEKSLDVSQQLDAIGKRNGDLQIRYWGLVNHATMALRLGRVDEAVSVLESHLEYVTEVIDSPESLNHMAMLALGYLRLGKLPQAWQRAKQALELMAAKLPSAFYALDGYVGTTEVLLELLQTPDLPAGIKRSDLKHACLQASRALARFGTTFRIGRADALHLQGTWHWLSGHPRRARMSWRKALLVSRETRMPYVEARVHLTLGRHAGRDADLRKQHLAAASSLFERLKTPHELTTTLALLEP